MGSAEVDVYSMPVEPAEPAAPRRSRRRRPAAVIVCAALFVIFGALSLEAWISAIIDGAVDINLNIFALPLGIALWLGKHWAWRLSRFALMAGMVLVLVVLAALLRHPAGAFVEWGDAQVDGHHALWIGLSLIGVLIGLQWLLYRWLGGEAVRNFFTAEVRPLSR